MICMNRFNRLLLTLGVFVVLIIGFYLITGAITKFTGYSISLDDKHDFKACLSEQDIVLYINSGDAYKTLEDIETKEYLTYVRIMNCVNNNDFCLDKGIKSFPSWIINNQKFEGDVSISELSGFSGCKYE